MANQMRGRVYQVLAPETNGNFTKQSLVLDCTTYDQYTGEPRSNFPKFEFNGDRGLGEIAKVSVGDIVTVSFVVKGRYYKNRADEEVNGTYVQGYKIELVEQKSAPAPGPAQTPAPAPTPYANTPAPAYSGPATNASAPATNAGDGLPPLLTHEPDFVPMPATKEDNDERDPF